MSNLNGRRSSFPQQIDSIIELFSLPAAMKDSAVRYQSLRLKISLTSDEQVELNSLTGTLQEYIVDVEKWNLFGDIIVNMQNFFINNTQGYIDNLKDETRIYVDNKAEEMNLYADGKKIEFQDIMNKFTYRGAYDSGETYSKWNVVTYNGESYLSLQASNINRTPNLAGSSTYWGKIATRGVKGDSGIGITYAGQYNNSTNYVAGDAVNHNETIYECIATTIGNEPPDNTYWRYFMSSNAILVSSVEPSSPTTNQIWLDTRVDNQTFKYWGGTAWIGLNALNADTLGGMLPDEFATNQIATSLVDGLMSSEDKAKLNNLEINSNNYIHPMTDGNLHVPATGVSNNGKVLKAGASAGSITWSEDKDTITTINGKTGVIAKSDIVALGVPASDTTYSLVTPSIDGLMSKDDKSKLNGIASGAEVNAVKKVAGKTGDVVVTHVDVGLGNVTNTTQFPITGGTLTGVAVGQANTSYTTRQLRNVILSTGNPSGGANGDIWIKYE